MIRVNFFNILILKLINSACEIFQDCSGSLLHPPHPQPWRKALCKDKHFCFHAVLWRPSKLLWRRCWEAHPGTGHVPASILVHPLHQHCQPGRLLAQLDRLIFSSAVSYILCLTGNAVKNKLFTCVLQSPYLCSSPAAHVCGWKMIGFFQAQPTEQGPPPGGGWCALPWSNGEATSSCWCQDSCVLGEILIIWERKLFRG